MDTSSSGRTWSARVLLALAAFWIVVSVIFVLSGKRSLAHALDFTNPSPLGLIGFFSLIAYFLVRPRTKPTIQSTGNTSEGRTAVKFQVGDHIVHVGFGPGTITEVNSNRFVVFFERTNETRPVDRVSVALDQGRTSALSRNRDPIEQAGATADSVQPPSL
jgi:hypothetical protein